MTAVLKGSDVLARRFAALSRGLRGSVLAEAALAGGKVVADDARRMAPRDTGTGAESIHAAVSEKSAAKASADVSWGAKHFYMKFHEFGTKFRAARPFLRPAFDSRKRAATTVMRRIFKRQIDRARRS